MIRQKNEKKWERNKWITKKRNKKYRLVFSKNTFLYSSTYSGCCHSLRSILCFRLPYKNQAKSEKKIRKYEIFVKSKVIKPINYRTTIETMGTVVPSQEVDIIPEVTGRVITISKSLIPGGILRKGQKIIKINPEDYELVYLQKKSELQTAVTSLKVEQGQQIIAKKEYELLGKKLREGQKELLLRKPQLQSAKQAVEAKKAALKKATIDLNRTLITSPFDALVLEKYIGLGSKVSSSTKIAKVVAIDEYWIETAIPLDQLSQIQLPKSIKEKGSFAKVINLSWGKGYFRNAYIKRLMPTLDEEGRMAKLLIAVSDPLCREKENQNKKSLILGSFVQVNIQGRMLENVVPIPRSYIHDGKYIWINKSGKLKISTIEILWKDRDYVYVGGESISGKKIIFSDIPAAVDGMKIKEVSP